MSYTPKLSSFKKTARTNPQNNSKTQLPSSHVKHINFETPKRSQSPSPASTTVQHQDPQQRSLSPSRQSSPSSSSPRNHPHYASTTASYSAKTGRKLSPPKLSPVVHNESVSYEAPPQMLSFEAMQKIEKEKLEMENYLSNKRRESLNKLLRALMIGQEHHYEEQLALRRHDYDMFLKRMPFELSGVMVILGKEIFGDGVPTPVPPSSTAISDSAVARIITILNIHKKNMLGTLVDAYTPSGGRPVFSLSSRWKEMEAASTQVAERERYWDQKIDSDANIFHAMKHEESKLIKSVITPDLVSTLTSPNRLSSSPEKTYLFDTPDHSSSPLKQSDLASGDGASPRRESKIKIGKEFTDESERFRFRFLDKLKIKLHDVSDSLSVVQTVLEEKELVLRNESPAKSVSSIKDSNRHQEKYMLAHQHLAKMRKAMLQAELFYDQQCEIKKSLQLSLSYFNDLAAKTK